MKNLFLSPYALILGVIAVAAGWYEFTSHGRTTVPGNGQPFRITYAEMRIENEDKLVVPREMADEVWAYLLDRLVHDKTFIHGLDPALDSYWYDELFTDVYFDTPELTMLEHQSGIRLRTRVNLTDPDADKSGRTLLQIKLNAIDDNAMNRGEIKFDINPATAFNDPDDVHPVLGLLNASDRAQFKSIMTQLGIDPYSLKRILVIEQRRSSLYIPRQGEQFISIRLDELSSSMLWARWQHVELEPELNEIPYTEADAETRAYMESINASIINDIKLRFPEIQQDLTPKYNKAFQFFDGEIPGLRFLIRNNLIQ